MKPPRVPLYDFSDVLLHAQESIAKGHAEYQAAKGGDLRAAALATVLSRFLALPVNKSIVQLNSVGHTGADGFKRLANQAVFSGTAKLAPDNAQIQALRAKHGPELEEWWQQSFGFGFECLTRSEARYPRQNHGCSTIRDRLAAAGLAGGP